MEHHDVGTVAQASDLTSRWKDQLGSIQRNILRITGAVISQFGLFRLLNVFVNFYQSKVNESGGVRFPYVTKRPVGNIQILVYHRVDKECDALFPGISVDVFSKQMELLASMFNVCDLEEAVERMERKDVQPNTVVITFDDGYQDNFVNAFPVLQKFSMPATIFLVTDPINSCTLLWHDQVVSAFRKTSQSFLEKFDSSSKIYPLISAEDKARSLTEVLKLFRSKGDEERSFLMNVLMKKLNVEDNKHSGNLMLTWDQIKTMQQSGITFGAHTVTHPILSRVSLDRARMEIEESKRIIEGKLGTRVRAFAYPSGRKEDFNEKTKRIVREAGYACAVTTIFGTNGLGQDVFEMRREHPWEEDTAAFKIKLHWYKFRY